MGNHLEYVNSYITVQNKLLEDEVKKWKTSQHSIETVLPTTSSESNLTCTFGDDNPYFYTEYAKWTDFTDSPKNLRKVMGSIYKAIVDNDPSDKSKVSKHVNEGFNFYSTKYYLKTTEDKYPDKFILNIRCRNRSCSCTNLNPQIQRDETFSIENLLKFTNIFPEQKVNCNNEILIPKAEKRGNQRNNKPKKNMK